MTPTEFWDEAPSLMWSYSKAFRQKTKLIQLADNQLAYINNIYNISALTSVLSKMFGDTNTAKVEYMDIIDLDNVIADKTKQSVQSLEISDKERIDNEVKLRVLELQSILKK